MNRKQKIIVSITGIILVSLILIGLTYAYFLTKITGNTNEKSISVTTANLVLEYGENTNVVQGINNAEPGYSVEKIFTATNKGNSDVTYGAALENIVNELSRQEDLVYTLTCTSYLKEGFSLASDGTITGTVDGTCNGISVETKFPSTSNLSIMVNNTIDTIHTHAYKLTIKYKEMNVDQSDDMNKTFSAKVNIVDLNAVARNNPYKDNTSSLAYNIINNAMNKTNGTELVGTPNTIPGKESSGIQYYSDNVDEVTKEDGISISTTYQGYYWTYGTGYTVDENTGKFTLTGVSTCKYNDGTCNTTLVGKYLVASHSSDNSSSTDTKKTTTNLPRVYKVIEAPASSTSAIEMKVNIIIPISYNTEKVLSITNDDYGISYYYRGGVEDNYVNFAGMCWKIVRINGDGSIKLYLANKNATCYKNMTYENASIGNGIYGYSTTNDNMFKSNYTNSEVSGLADIFKKFQTTAVTPNINNYLNYLKAGDWCVDVYNNKNFSLKCEDTLTNKFSDKTDMYVGTVTATELIYAGALDFYSNTNNITANIFSLYYGYNVPTLSHASSFGDLGAQTPYGLYTYTGTSNELSVQHENYIISSGPFYYNTEFPAIPAVNLKKGTTISGGDGTISNPYVVKTN